MFCVTEVFTVSYGPVAIHRKMLGGKCLRESVVMYYYGGTFEKQQLARSSEKLHDEEFTNLCSKLLILSGVYKFRGWGVYIS